MNTNNIKWGLVMIKNLNRIFAVILSVCLIFALVACNSNKVDETDKPQPTTSEVEQDKTTSSSSSQETNSEENKKKIQYIDRYLDGTYSTTEAPSDAFEYVAGDSYKVLSGGADSEAAVLRNKILSAKDTFKPTGKVYYFSTDGNEDNDGLSKDKPLNDLSSLSALNLKSGDAVLFKRGCIFRTTSILRLTSGVYYGAYGEGAKPEIWGSEQNYAGKNLWKPYGNKKNFWVMELLRPDAGVLVINNGEIEGRKFSSANALTYEGDFYHNPGNAIYLYSEKNPNEYKSIEIGCAATIFIAPSGSKDIKIENISLKYTGTHGIQFGGKAQNIEIKNCELSWIGGCYQKVEGGQRYGNGIEFWDGATNITVSNCWIHKIFDAGLTFQGSNDFVDISFNNNLLEYCLMSIETWGRPQSSRPTTQIKNIDISDNILRFSGYSYGTERNDRSRGTHITFSASSYSNDYEDIIKNFVVKNNIFDCSYGTLIDHKWLESFSKSVGVDYIYQNNTYYMKEREHTDVIAAFGIKSTNYSEVYYAKNQQEFEKVISIIDKSPKLIKWVG